MSIGKNSRRALPSKVVEDPSHCCYLCSTSLGVASFDRGVVSRCCTCVRPARAFIAYSSLAPLHSSLVRSFNSSARSTTAFKKHS